LNPTYNSYTQVLENLKQSNITCQSLVEYYLTQIKDTQELNIYIEVFGEEALAQAQALDLKYKETPESVGFFYSYCYTTFIR